MLFSAWQSAWPGSKGAAHAFERAVSNQSSLSPLLSAICSSAPSGLPVQCSYADPVSCVLPNNEQKILFTQTKACFGTYYLLTLTVILQEEAQY